MMPEELYSKLLLIKSAIDLIEHADQEFREISASAPSTSAEREHCRQVLLGAKSEFRWQWENVKAVLAHYEKEEHAKRAVGSTPA